MARGGPEPSLRLVVLAWGLCLGGCRRASAWCHLTHHSRVLVVGLYPVPIDPDDPLAAPVSEVTLCYPCRIDHRYS